MRKINVLHIITHDTGRHLGCYGEDVKTPNLDKLAKDGVIFTNYFCTAPQCSPSRASMFSGLMPHNNGMIGLAHRGFKLKKNIPYLPEILSENGYNTFLFGLQHECEWESLNPQAEIKGPEELGYKKVFLGKSLFCEDVVPVVNKFLLNNPPEPFFMSVGFAETHKPYPEVKKVSKRLRVPSFLPESSEVKEDIAGLNVLVERVDKHVGKILDTLKKTSLYENTLVIFTTDHGIALPGAKATLFDPGIGILLLMHGPNGISGGRKVNSLLSNIDFTPTILDYLGINISDEMQGVSFLPVLRERKKEVREEINIELTYHASYDPMRGIRDRKFKYIRSFEARPFYFPPNVDDGPAKEFFRKKGYYEKIRPFEFLFDIENDPLEKNNLAGNPKYSQILKKYRVKLVNWMKKTNDPLFNGPVPLPEKGISTPPWSYTPEERWLK